ncbi:MAG: SDR family oxidoreductase [Pseudomonadota bacterium]
MTINAQPGVMLITGSGQRVGAHLARHFAAKGWAIGLHHNRSSAAAQAILDEIKAGGGTGALVAGDLSDLAATQAIIPAATRALGPVTCLVNNASLFIDDRVEAFDAALWDQHIAINLRAPAVLASAFAAQLEAPGAHSDDHAGAAGLIVNIIDQRVLKPTPHFFSYGVSKAGLWAATRTMAQALAPRIRVNAIGPGPVLQSIHQTPEQFAAQCAATLLKRGTNPEEIAQAIGYMLTAPAMTGQMVTLDGGQHLAWQTPDVVGVDA